MSFSQALVFRRCVFALRTVGVELRLSVFGSSLHLDAASDAQTAWLHVAFCSNFFRSLRAQKPQLQREGEAEEEEAGEKGEGQIPVFCVTLPIRHLWRILLKVSLAQQPYPTTLFCLFLHRQPHVEIDLHLCLPTVKRS